LHIARNPVFDSRTKHFNITFREVIEERCVDMLKIHTKDNLAYAITKLINTNKFE